MREFLNQSMFFSLALSLSCYELGVFVRKKTGLALFNPLFIAIGSIISLLLLLGVDYAEFERGSSSLSYLLTPSTVALAVPLYRQFSVLKKNTAAVFAGIVSGVLTGLFSTLILAVAFKLTHEEYVTLLPKSITTAIGMGMSAELGGVVTITVAGIILTGIFGNMAGGAVCRFFHIKERIAVGIALGTSAHAIGTVRAMEMGEVEGAVGSLSIVIAGLFTVLGANIFAAFL